MGRRWRGGARVTEYEQSAKRDAGKVRYELVQWPFVTGIASVLTFGAAKYAAESWRDVPQAKPRYFAATIRHILAWWGGELIDPESGLPHLHHAACNLMFLDSLPNEVPK